MPKLTCMDLFNSRYAGVHIFVPMHYYYVALFQLHYIFMWLQPCLVYVNDIKFLAGILFPLGNACFGCYFWFRYSTRLVGNRCRTSILFLDSVASSCHREEHIKNSKMGVSLFIFFHFEILVSSLPNKRH